MSEADKNLTIALAISPDRSGWAWSTCGLCHGAGWAWRGEVDPTGQHEELSAGYSQDATKYRCPRCSGTGRVPIDLANPAHTLELVEWASQHFKGQWAIRDEFAHPFHRLATGTLHVEIAAARIRDLICEALKGPARDG